MNVDEFFYEYPVFRYEEFAQFKLQQREIKPSSVHTALAYYCKKGRIKSIRRKLYAVVTPNESIDNVLIDPYLIAAKVTEDAIVGYHSALELLGVAYSSFGQLTYITKQNSKPFEFDGNWYQSVASPIALQKTKTTEIYVDSLNRNGVDIKVTNAARTFVDVLDRIELCGGWKEVFRSISNIAVLNLDQVVDYCLMLGNARLNAKVGYFLSLRKGAFAATEQQLAALLAEKPKVPQYLKGAVGEQCQLIKQWNIYLPLSVINQTWEEPDVDL